MINSHGSASKTSSRLNNLIWKPSATLLSDVKTLCVIFAFAAGAGLVVIVATSGLRGSAGTALQGIGAALFTAGLIAFPLAILGHSELTGAAQKDLEELRKASAEKILEERLSRQHLQTLREDMFGKPVIGHYQLHVALHEEQAEDGSPIIILEHRREYTVIDRDATGTLIDILHHATGPLNPGASGRLPGFTYVNLEMKDEGDPLEWNHALDSDWDHSEPGRSVRRWRDGVVSIGREAHTGNFFSMRTDGLHMKPGSELRAKIISEKQVSPTGAEPFVVFLPTIELEVVVACSPSMKVDLFPLHEVQSGGLVRRAHVAPASDNRMQETTWRWGKALFSGQGVVLRWANALSE
jgi:hypothetical protein